MVCDRVSMPHDDVDDHLAVLCRADEVIKQDRDVVALMDVATHKRG